MITVGDKEVVARHYGELAVTYVYRGLNLVWQLVSSCFGAGYWRNDCPWKNTDPWKNN